MRPSPLDPLFAPASTLPGIGPRTALLIDRATGADGPATVRDVLFHLPAGFIDRSDRPPLWQLPRTGVVTVEGVVERHDRPRPGSSAPWRVILAEGNATVQIAYFNPRPDWMLKLFPPGERRIVSGAVEWFDLRPQIVHPDHVLSIDEAGDLPAADPVYGLAQGLSAKVMRRAVSVAIERVPILPEWLSGDLRSTRPDWPDFRTALSTVHRPEALQAAGPESDAWRRLAFDELLASQLALALARGRRKRARGTAWSGDGALSAAIEAALPFALTPSQGEALAEIAADLAGPDRMLRLLQGDVGSGKTVVAVLAMARVAEAGGQAALMAPTELLARQHFATVEPLARAAGLDAVLLTGKAAVAERAAAEDRLTSGAAAIAVGTHALFQERTTFRRLGLVVVDEQHRFGVHQRLALSRKGDAPDILVMTATPIPRTLVLSWFGDMEVSRLTGKPAGRQPIDTRAVSLERLDEVAERIGATIAAGGKAYWVCPLVAESEKVDAAAAEARYAALRTVFGDRVALLHGRMSPAEKDAVMDGFRFGRTPLLVATTVVEVGVDVPDATVMVIEGAERFGLAQLHQLRGRVGRGEKRSACLLLYKPPLGETARRRLAVMRETEDGFAIAEEDLKLRGEGDVLGTRQSGMPAFRIARPDIHADLLPLARDEAKLALARDPGFSSSRAEALRTLLYLFGRDDAVRLMRSG